MHKYFKTNISNFSYLIKMEYLKLKMNYPTCGRRFADIGTRNIQQNKKKAKLNSSYTVIKLSTERQEKFEKVNKFQELLN